MPRTRIYTDVAEKQKAYRERGKQRELQEHGGTDEEIVNKVKDLHQLIRGTVESNPKSRASKILGNSTAETLERIAKYFGVDTPSA